MPVLSAQLLGPLVVRAEDCGMELPAAHKAQELLCFLLLRRGHPVRRDPLSSLLWADVDTRRSRKYLRQALWQLQSAIGYSVADQILDVGVEAVRLQGPPDAWLDVVEFQAAADAVRGISAQRLSAAEASAADRAVRLYRGDLLEGYDFDWCLVERESVRNSLLMLLDKLMLYCEATREYDHAIAYGEQVLSHDTAREYTHRHLMRLHHLRGDRTGALRQYARCTRALCDELGALPGRSTTMLREQIRNEETLESITSTDDLQRNTEPSFVHTLEERLLRLRHEVASLGHEISALRPSTAATESVRAGRGNLVEDLSASK